MAFRCIRCVCWFVVVVNSCVLCVLLLLSDPDSESLDAAAPRDVGLLDLDPPALALAPEPWRPRQILSREHHFDRLRLQFSDVTKEADLYDWVSLSPDPNQSNITQDSLAECQECFERPAVVAYGLKAVQSRLNTTSSVEKTFSVFSIENKIGPITAMKEILQPMGAKFTEVSLSPLRTQQGEHELTSELVSYVGKDGTNVLHQTAIWEFWRRYLNDTRVSSADVYLCISPASMCELFQPLAESRGRSLIVVVDGRYELGRQGAEQWRHWNTNLQTIAADRRNIVTATSVYDAEYVRHFTGLDLPVMPYQCDYITERYDPTERSYLLLPTRKRGFDQMILSSVANITKVENLNRAVLHLASDLHPGYTPRDLASHRGVVVIPHQVSYLALTELLRTNTPVLFPSIQLLARWHADVRVMTDRTLRRTSANARAVRDGAAIQGSSGLPDPNTDSQMSDLGFWVSFVDIYSVAGVTFFSSVEDLARKMHKLTDVHLMDNSRKLRKFNKREKERIRTFWESALTRIRNQRTQK